MLTRTIDHIQHDKFTKAKGIVTTPEPVVYDEVGVALWTIYFPGIEPVTLTLTADDLFDLDPATELMRVEKDGRVDVYHLDKAYFYTAKRFMRKVVKKPYVPTTPGEAIE